jgi:hypothetical protein
MNAIQVETFYVGSPSVPAGLTIDEYRRGRPHKKGWLRRAANLFGFGSRPSSSASR